MGSLLKKQDINVIKMQKANMTKRLVEVEDYREILLVSPLAKSDSYFL